jgi:hypothetical protein
MRQRQVSPIQRSPRRLAEIHRMLSMKPVTQKMRKLKMAKIKMLM